MTDRTVRLKILRYKPGHMDPPRFQEFEVAVTRTMSVLDCLEKIRIEQDAGLMYRHACHHGSCGTCACRINGRERLACTTLAAELEGGQATLEPLAGFTVLGDLVVDMAPFFNAMPENWGYLRPAENTGSTRLPRGIDRFERFENCIECGACVSACPVMRKTDKFMGPAALAAINGERLKTGSADLVAAAGGRRGERWCERALACSRACPTGVFPARHIADIRRLLQKGDKTD